MRDRRVSFCTLFFGLLVVGSLAVAGMSSIGGTAELIVGIERSPLGDLSFGTFDSIVDLYWQRSHTLVTSYTEIDFARWIWQEFGGSANVAAIEGDAAILFGPATADYLYAEAAVSLALGGVNIECRLAQLSDAVLGGPADGWVLYATIGLFDDVMIASTTGFGATRDGLTIYHTATGRHRSFVTNPVVPGQGFTSQMIEVLNVPLTCGVRTDYILEFSCTGFEYFLARAREIPTTLPYLTVDATLLYQLQTKSITISPNVDLGALSTCLRTYAALGDALGDFILYGTAIDCNLGVGSANVRFQDVSVLDAVHYALVRTAAGYDIAPRTAAYSSGNTVFEEFWEVMSIGVYMPGIGCCGSTTFEASAFFEEGSTSLFDWSLSVIEAQVGVALNAWFSLGLEVDQVGLRELCFGFGYGF